MSRLPFGGGLFFYHNTLMDIIAEIVKGQEANLGNLRSSIERGLTGSSIEMDEPQGFRTDGVFFGDIPPKRGAADQLKAAIGWVYACVSAIADSVAKVDIGLYEIDKQGNITEVENHAATELLDRVNAFTTRYDHTWLTQQYLDLTGEAPWFIDRGESGEGEPKSILLLRPDALAIVQSKDKSSPTPIEKYVYKMDLGTDMDIKPSELVFLKYPDPVNAFRGKGTLQAAARTVDIDEYSEEFNKRFFFNSARPDTVLSSDQKLSAAQKATLSASVKKLYQGVDKAHKTLVLESGLKFAPMTLSQKDMDFLQQQEYDAKKIMAIFRVPKAVLGMAEDVNLANAKIGEYVFSKYTVRPKLDRIVAQLNEFYLPMFKGTERMFLAYEDPVPQDVDAEVKRYDSALGKGWMTINEVRAAQNLEDIGEQGDVIYLPNVLVPLDMLGSQPAAPANGYPTKGIGSFKVRRSGSRTLTERRGIMARSGGGYARAKQRVEAQKARAAAQATVEKDIKHIEGKIDQVAANMVRSIVTARRQKSKQAEATSRAVHQQFGKLFVRAMDEHEKVMLVTTRTMFQNQMEKIVRKFPMKAIIDINEYQLDEEDETRVMVQAYQPQLHKIIDDQGHRASQLIGAGHRFSLATKTVQDYLGDRTFKFSFEVTEETNRLLKDTLKEGVAAGEGIPDLTKRVRGLFDNFEKYRAERIARSEVVRASNFAATEAYDQSGVVDKLQWLTTEDEHTCQWCEPMDGREVSLGGSFFDKGDTFRGLDGGTLNLNYESVDFPPLHPNCRCTVVPIVK